MADKKNSAHAVKRAIKTAMHGLPTDLSGQFEECLFDCDLAFAKYWKIVRVVDQISRALQTLRTSTKFADVSSAKFADACRNVEIFVRESCMSMSDGPAIPQSDPSFDQLPDAKKEHFHAAYDEMRKAHVVKLLIQACDTLDPYKPHIENRAALNGYFLVSMPGVSFTPFANFDVKDAYLQTEDKAARESILIYLHELYTLGFQLYNAYTAPDMNVDQMANVVRNAIAQLRREPSLSRCDAAFAKIEESLALLKTNFGDYYTEFVQSRSPMVLFEHYVRDVAQNTKSRKKSALLAAQFNKIVGFYRHAAQNVGISKQAESLFARFSEFNSQFEAANLSRSRTKCKPKDDLAP
jgi:hypothetical protein